MERFVGTGSSDRWGALQVAILIVGWEYERQKGKDLEKSAKEKAFQEKDLADKRVRGLIPLSLYI